jgi:AraC-like DNA-binding protein
MLLLFLVRDFVQWNVHRLLHRAPRLWEFHKVHHSVQQMGFAAHLRYHFMENIVYRTLEYIPLESHLQQILDEYRTYHGEFKNDLMRALLLQLLIHIVRNIETAPTDHVSKHDLTVLRNYQKLIEQHYRSLRLPKDYADLMYITPNHLNAICNATTGKAAGELIRDRVLLEAKRMLVNAEYSIAEVGYELDFQDNAYFSRFFKKYTGVTPEEFRKSGGNVTVTEVVSL